MRLLSKITSPADLENLPKLMDSVSHCLVEQGFESEKRTEIEIAMEEALVNIISYAYQDRSGDVTVCCGLDDESRFVIEIEDQGRPFDVLSVNQPDLSDSISDRQVGGLGVHLIRNLMSDVKYIRKNDKNILQLIP